MKKKLKNGDTKKILGISFTWNGKRWIINYLNHIKNSRE